MILPVCSRIRMNPTEPCTFLVLMGCNVFSFLNRMELALQVVGLKMTGKIEDAKNVAMRIVGNASDNSDSRNGVNGSDMMQLASFSLPARDIRQLLLSHASDSNDFESLIVRFLSILDTPLDRQSATTLCSAISHQTTSGQTLLHLACFLAFPTLVSFLILHEADLDVRDRNGLTALHFSVIGKSKTCARLLVEAGADMEIVNVLGKTPQEEAPPHFFDDMSFDNRGSDTRTHETADDEDGESCWGDGEEDASDISVPLARRTSGRRLLQRESISRELSVGKPTLDDALPSIPTPPTVSDNEKPLTPNADEKQTASFVDMIQRTLAQLHGQGIIPNIPQLPLPHIPHLPGMPAVPWGALPQLPMVFPVIVPMPGWPSFLGEKRIGQTEVRVEKDSDQTSHTVGGGAIRTAQDWVNTWMAVAIATATRQQNEDTPPPVYTPRAVSEEPQLLPSLPYPPDSSSEQSSSVPAPPLPIPDRTTLRRVGYDDVPVTDQEVNAFAYQPARKHSHKLQKKSTLSEFQKLELMDKPFFFTLQRTVCL